MCILVGADITGKELHRRGYMCSTVTSGSLGDEMVSSLAQNARDMGSILLLGIVFPIFITRILYKVCAV